MFIHTITTRSQCHHQQQTTYHRQRLEEIILEEITHGFVIRDVPPCIEIHIKRSKPSDEDEGGDFSLESDGDEDDERGADEVLYHVEERELEP